MHSVALTTANTSISTPEPATTGESPVTRADKGLLAQDEDGALDSSTSLADTLRKCIALGGQAGSEELRDWARRELDGYKVEDELPEYRVFLPR